MTDLTIQQEHAVAFARYMARNHDDLELWTSDHAANYIPPATAFGATNGAPDLSFEYWPMTPEEYMAKTDRILPEPERRLEVLPNAVADTAWFITDHLFLDGIITDDGDVEWYWYHRAAGTLGAPHGMKELWAPTPQDAPWAEPLHREWSQAVDNRCREVDDVRAELEYLTETLIAVADKYMEVDIENEAELANTELGRES